LHSEGACFFQQLYKEPRVISSDTDYCFVDI